MKYKYGRYRFLLLLLHYVQVAANQQFGKYLAVVQFIFIFSRFVAAFVAIFRFVARGLFVPLPVRSDVRPPGPGPARRDCMRSCAFLC